MPKIYPVTSRGKIKRTSLRRKIAATVAILAAAAGLELFVALGSFDHQHTVFTPSVIAGR
jgi:hypothetical protein